MFTGQWRERFTKVPSVSQGGVIGKTWHEGLSLIPAIRVGAEPLCAVTQYSIGAEGPRPGQDQMKWARTCNRPPMFLSTERRLTERNFSTQEAACKQLLFGVYLPFSMQTVEGWGQMLNLSKLLLQVSMSIYIQRKLFFVLFLPKILYGYHQIYSKALIGYVSILWIRDVSFNRYLFTHNCFPLQYLYVFAYIILSKELLSIWRNLNDAFHADFIHLEVKKYVYVLNIKIMAYGFKFLVYLTYSKTPGLENSRNISIHPQPRIPIDSGGCRNRSTLVRVQCGIWRKSLRVS